MNKYFSANLDEEVDISFTHLGTAAMPACSSLSRTLASALQTPLIHHHAHHSKPSIQIPHHHHSLPLPHPPYPSSPAFAGGIAAASEAVILANAAAEAARDALDLAHALTKIDLSKLAGSHELEEHMRERRRRRRRQRRGFELDDGDKGGGLAERWLSRADRLRCLTRDQEAEFSSCLKVDAMLEILPCGNSKQISSAVLRVGRRRNERVLLKARECRERITLSYKRLVISVAAAYQGKGLSLQDLIQEGCIGLLRGAKRFDYKKGNKMSTYVYWWIKQAIIKALAKNSNIIRLPGYLCTMTARVGEAKSLLRDRLKRLPTYEEISETVGISASSVRIICEHSRRPVSIDQPINGEKITLKDIIQGPDERGPEIMVNRQHMLQNMEVLLKTLGEREEHIIRLYYGINGEIPLTFDEIGRALNLSRERVRQIYCNALSNLKEDKTVTDGFKHFVV